MDTKSKKWKIAVSFAVFFLGVSLVIGCSAEVALNLMRRPYSDKLSDAFQKDYQNTAAFRNEMSSKLETFLTMATDGPLYNNYYTYSEEEWDQQFMELGNASSWGWDDEDYEVTPEERKRYAQAAKKTDSRLQDDKNLLYQITYNGVTKYENASGVGTLDGPSRKMPEGYNFLLYFDGTRAVAVKDGAELDIYGDGIYQDGDWYLPGYKNFTVDETTSKATVCIAALKEPQIFLNGSYSSRNSVRQSNELYWISHGLAQVRSSYLWACVGFLAGLLLLAPAFLWRRDVGAANRAIARVTGRIWFEGKLLLWAASAVLLLLFVYMSAPYLRDFVYDFLSSNMPVSEFLYAGVNPGILVALFWCWFLIVNDLCRNRQIWKHSLTSKLSAALRLRSAKYPIQDRMTRFFLPVYLTELVLGIGAFATACVSGKGLSYLLSIVFCACLVALVLISQYLWYRRTRDAARDIGAVADQIAAVRDGNLTEGLTLPEDADLRKAAEQLSDIRQGMQAAVDDQVKSERTKVELVTNVSHDLKTPLTSIVSYVDLLKQEELPAHVRDYVQILDEKAQRLKSMVLDVFEVSKAASGQLPVKLEELDLVKLLRQTVADMEERIAESTVTVRTELPEEPVHIFADGNRLYRVFQNLLGNALQYSLEGSRVYISLHVSMGTASACVKNTSKQELPKNVDLTERFVRGDESRADGGSGLGLSIASSFTQACGGSFRVENIADLFVATVEFKVLP